MNFLGAVVFNNDNLRINGKIIYAPDLYGHVPRKNNVAPTHYKVDLTMLQ